MRSTRTRERWKVRTRVDQRGGDFLLGGGPFGSSCLSRLVLLYTEVEGRTMYDLPILVLPMNFDGWLPFGLLFTWFFRVDFYTFMWKESGHWRWTLSVHSCVFQREKFVHLPVGGNGRAAVIREKGRNLCPGADCLVSGCDFLDSQRSAVDGWFRDWAKPSLCLM